MMTPLVLIFIGLAVKIKWKEFKMIFNLLLWRSGFAFFLSALVLLLIPPASWEMMMLIVIFPQSAASFWPFAHMSLVNHMEEKIGKEEEKTFNVEFALSIMACSLPFSTFLILVICTIGLPFTNPSNLGLIGIGCLGLAILPKLFSYSKKSEAEKKWQHAQHETN
jgi:hypothetical protein